MPTITDRQRAFAERLLSERLVTLNADSLDDAVRKLHLKDLTVDQAKTVIDRLLALPADPDPTMPPIVAKAQRHGVASRPGACSFCGGLVKAGEGFYYSDNGGWSLHHRIGECQEKAAPLPELEPGLYRVDDLGVALIYKTRNQRLGGKLLSNGSFNYLTGLVMQVRGALTEGNAHRVTAQEAREYGYLNQHCIACGLPLTDPRSDPLKGGAGYGPTCARKYSWPWG